jgi:hypothetical protein
MRRFLEPSIPFLFTIPAAVVARFVWRSWQTDSHDMCEATQPFWNTAFLWVPGLGLLGLAAAVFCSFAPGTPRPLRVAGPLSAVTVLVWSGWFFQHAFRFDWCV